MERLLFDRRGKRICIALWLAAWLVVAALLLMPLGISTPDRSDLVAHFMLFASLAFGAVSFTRRVWQLACLGLATDRARHDARVRAEAGALSHL